MHQAVSKAWLLLAAALTAAGCATPVVEEAWLTARDEAANVDSVAVWHGPDKEHRLIATAKESDTLQVFDAGTGRSLGRIGGTGDALGRFLRPNGITVIDDLVLVVERDNHRVQALRMPDLEPIGVFGEEQLSRPYGIYVRRTGQGYRAYVTDNYELPDESIPPNDELGRRLHMFDFTVADSGIRMMETRAAGVTSGAGVLKKVESLHGDPRHDRLLVADEAEIRRNVKVFDLDGEFTGEVIGDGLFLYEPEGIALYACTDGSGYWVITDQEDDDNRFLLFDRETLRHAGAFGGRTTRNTDGIWLTRTPMPGFPAGAFYAVHDDGNIAAFGLDQVFTTLELASCGEPVAAAADAGP